MVFVGTTILEIKLHYHYHPQSIQYALILVAQLLV